MSTIRGDSAPTKSEEHGPLTVTLSLLAMLLAVGGLVALFVSGLRLTGLAAIAVAVDLVVVMRVPLLWSARPLEARAGRDALGMVANKLGALLVPVAAVAAIPERTRPAGVAALVAGVLLVAASNLVVMRGRQPLNPDPPATRKPAAGEGAPADDEYATGGTTDGRPTAPLWRPGAAAPAGGSPPDPAGPDDWILSIVALGALAVLGGLLATAVWEDHWAVEGWVVFGGVQTFVLALSVFLWRTRGRDGGATPTGAGHLAATLGWVIVLCGLAASAFDTPAGVAGRAAGFVGVGLLVLGHGAAAVRSSRPVDALDRALLAVLAVCLPLTLLTAYGWTVRTTPDYVATYGREVTVWLPETCTVRISLGERDGESRTSCDDATWTVDGVEYRGGVAGTLGEMGGIAGHVSSVSGYATKARSHGADLVAENRPAGPATRFGRVPVELGLTSVGVVAAVLLLWRRRPDRGRR